MDLHDPNTSNSIFTVSIYELQIFKVALAENNAFALDAVIDSLFSKAMEAHSRSDVKAIVITGAKGRFSAGFDINQFQQIIGSRGVDMTYALELFQHVVNNNSACMLT